MALLTVDDEAFAATIGQIMRQRIIQIEAFTLLIKFGHFEIDTKAQSA